MNQPQAAAVPPPEGTDLSDRPWIVVDRQRHTLTLMRNGQAEFSTYVSLGRAGKDTPEGDYSTWGKYRADNMSSAANPDAERPYHFPNVPFVQYYLDGGYAIHGTYWHDQFGTDESQGCINLTWADAQYLFAQTRPEVPQGQGQMIEGRQATPVVVRG
jgi:lipoprotein-anchoring transpeptidase ErfK/SrfK